MADLIAVPKEPTEMMKVAGSVVIHEWLKSTNGRWVDMAGEIYRMMVANAPGERI